MCVGAGYIATARKTGGEDGTVTSVALSLPNIFSVTGSPITISGTLAATLASQTQNRVFASPDGSSGAPAFRALTAADIPDLSSTYLVDADIGVSVQGYNANTTLLGNTTTGTGSIVRGTSPTVSGMTANGVTTFANGSAAAPSIVFAAGAASGFASVGGAFVFVGGNVSVLAFERPGGSTGRIYNPTNSTAAHLEFRAGSATGAIMLMNGTGVTTLNATLAATNAVTDLLTVSANSSGTPAAGLGSGIVLAGESSTTNDTALARLRGLFTTTTHASRASRAVLSGYDSTGERDVIGWGANGSASILGFHDKAAAPIAQAVLATGAGRTVDDVITALQNLGLVKQS